MIEILNNIIDFLLGGIFLFCILYAEYSHWITKYK
jgi:hypothetical protein